MKAPRLSVVVVTRNEEERIRACLDSVAWADELIVVDAESEDKTASIARELTDHVFVRPWPGYAAQKNFGIEQAHGEWILSLDADEIVSAELRAEIQAVLAGGGGGDAARRTVQETHAQSGLELAQCVAERGLRHAHAGGRTGETAFIGHGHESAQIADVIAGH